MTSLSFINFQKHTCLKPAAQPTMWRSFVVIGNVIGYCGSDFGCNSSEIIDNLYLTNLPVC